MEADAAFGGAAGIVVLHAETLESLIAAIVHPHGDAEMQLAHRHTQESVHGRRKAQDGGCVVKLALCDLERV